LLAVEKRGKKKEGKGEGTELSATKNARTIKERGERAHPICFYISSGREKQEERRMLRFITRNPTERTTLFPHLQDLLEGKGRGEGKKRETLANPRSLYFSILNHDRRK